MPDAFSGTSALADQVKAAYDRDAFFALRSQAVFDQFARVKPGNVTSPGSSVSFLFWANLSVATTALSETVDVDAVALSDSLVTLTPAEYGNAVLTTVKVMTDTYLVGFDADASNIVSYNMVDTLDTIAQEAVESGATTTTVDGGAEASLTAGDVLTMNAVRKEVAALRKNSVAPMNGSYYAALIHPDVSFDLQTATAGTDWAAFVQRQPGAADQWYNGQIMRAGGVDFIETPRVGNNVDGGASNEDVYSTYILGQDALGKAESIPPHIVAGPVTDKLMRFRPLGWHAYLAYGVIRAVAARNVLACSSIGTN